MVFILSNVMKFAVPMGLFVWSLFQPAIAGYTFVGLTALCVVYLFFTDIANCPKPDPLLWMPYEIKVMREYHLALRFPLDEKKMNFKSLKMWIAVAVISVLTFTCCFAEENGQLRNTERYNVGFQILKVPYQGPEPLVIALWYPTKAESKEQKYVPAIPHLKGKVAVDAVPAKGPFPLVIFSHGGIGAGICAMSWAEALAAEGFVVAAPDHKDKTVLLRSDMKNPPTREQIREALRWAMRLSRRRQGQPVDRNEYLHRPEEIRVTIDMLLEASIHKTSQFHGLVESERIGMTGVSFGAWTTLAMAGGYQLFHDPRIKAAIPMAGGFEKSSMDPSSIHVPLMFIFGEKETVVLLDKDPSAPMREERVVEDYNKIGPPKFLIGIKGVEHLDFDADGMTTRGSLRRPGWIHGKVYSTGAVRKNDPVIRTIVRYQIAFWRRYLLDDRDAEKILTTQDKPTVYIFKADLGVEH